MREIARRIVPICSNYSLVIRFVEGYKLTRKENKKKIRPKFFVFIFEEKSYFKWGLVNHALCAAIKELLKVNKPTKIMRINKRLRFCLNLLFTN